MKYVITTALLGVVLMGCTDKKDVAEPSTHDQNVPAKVNPTTETETAIAIDQNAQDDQEIHFTGPNDLTLILKTTDNFETAELRDNSDQTYQLKRVVSGSGIRLANEEGMSIHFKNFDGVNEGTVELVKDKPIEIKEHR